MLDIKSFIKAQKIIWVKIFLSPEQASWKAMLSTCLEDFIGADTFKCAMNCTQQPEGFPDFYWQMLKIWYEIKNLTESIDTPLDVRRQCLWLNENISANKKHFKWDEWRDKGVNIIHDILHDTGDFLTAAEIGQQYGINCDVMKYNKLKDSIPKEWRSLLKTMKIPNQAINFKEAIHVKIGKQTKNINLIKNNEIYWTIVNDIRIESIVTNKLIRELGIQEEKCKNVFTMPRVVSNTKIRAFQFKLLYNLIPCNLYLKRI